MAHPLSPLDSPKNFHLTERMRLRFEGTFTNLLNHPNFAPPTNVAAFGVPQSVQTAENSGNRTGQFGLRIEF